MKILTSKGFRDFDGVISNGVKTVGEISIDGNTIRCTPEHRVFFNDVWKNADSFEDFKELNKEEVFDAVNVSDGHEYLTNGVPSHNCLYLDEFAHVEKDVEFWTSAYPTISSGKKTKVIITSTPRGMNLFYKLWSDSVNKTNPFVNVFFPWTANPTRDAKWEKEQRQVLGTMKFRQEVSCLHGDTKLRVRKIGTFKDETLTFFELAKRLYQRELSDNLIIINQEYEIDTPKGFRNFAGLRVTKKKFISIKTEKNVIKATPDHKFIVRGREVLAKNLKIGKHIDPGVCVEDIWDDKETGFAFDPLNVDYGNIYLAGGVLNHNCEFLGSSGTLISGDKLQKLIAIDPQIVSENGEYLIYAPPKKDSRYIICVDSAEGVGSDYSAAIVFDVTQKPFTIAAIYKSNIVPPEVYSGILNILGKRFNNALLIVETNSVGYTVAKDLWFEYEYENMLRSADHGEGVLASFSGTSKVGVKTTKSTKRLGCSTLKSLIETDLMIINDLGIINELSTFVSKGTSWEAEKNKHDDLVMCLVIFAWFTQQTMFDEYVTSPINTLLRELRVNDSIGLPDMIITNGMEEDFYSDNGLDRSLSMDVVEREDIYERDNDERVKDEMPFF